MSLKVKRGLGLLVIGIPAWIVSAALVANDVSTVVLALPALVALVCVAAGIVLLAWGLLRD